MIKKSVIILTKGLNKASLFVRRIKLIFLKYILWVVDSILGLAMAFPDLFCCHPFCDIPLISYYPKTKKGLIELEKELNSIAVGIGIISKKSESSHFKELVDIVQRVYGTCERMPTEIKIEVHADNPQINSITDEIYSNQNRYYLNLRQRFF